MPKKVISSYINYINNYFSGMPYATAMQSSIPSFNSFLTAIPQRSTRGPTYNISFNSDYAAAWQDVENEIKNQQKLYEFFSGANFVPTELNKYLAKLKITYEDFQTAFDLWGKKSFKTLEDYIDSLPFMKPNLNLDSTNIRIEAIKLRYNLFDRIPSVTNMILLFEAIENLTLKLYEQSKIQIEEKVITKFDKCKALALGTKNFNERKTAVAMALNLAERITKLNLNGKTNE